jgi:hypothetical protein
MPPSLKLAQRLALGVPALLLAGAYISEYGFGLYPCEMCWWQRYAHFAAVALALVSTVARRSGCGSCSPGWRCSPRADRGVHAGVEYGWWEGFTACTTTVEDGGDPLEAILNAPLIRCDVAPWTLGAAVRWRGSTRSISVTSAWRSSSAC